MYKSLLLISIIAGLFSCSSRSIKDKINKAGDIAGQATGEFVEGAAKGVTKAFDVKITLSPELIKSGIQLGKTSVTNDSLGTDNLLVAYVIFNKDFKGELMAKAYDENMLEMGRSGTEVKGKKDEAIYVDFHFDQRINLDARNKITIE